VLKQQLGLYGGWLLGTLLIIVRLPGNQQRLKEVTAPSPKKWSRIQHHNLSFYASLFISTRASVFINCLINSLKIKKNILSITTSLNDLIITKPYILRKHSSWGEREIIYWQLTMDQGQTKAEGSLLLTWTNYSDEKGKNETTIPPQKKQSPASAAHLRWLFVDGVRKLSSWPECCGFLVCGEENIPAIFIQSRRYAPAWQCNSVWHLTRLTIFAQETHYPKAFHHVNLNQILSQKSRFLLSLVRGSTHGHQAQFTAAKWLFIFCSALLDK